MTVKTSTRYIHAAGVKYSSEHAYAAIEWRVIDSPAYSDLTFSARSLLTLITRQLSKDNNGHLQATYSYLKRFGFDSEHTISRCIKQLISHGMIYRSRAGGYQQGAAQYAVTWLPIKNKQGLFLAGFKSCAWRDWIPDEKKSPPTKMQYTHCKKVIGTTQATAKCASDSPLNFADTELIPCRCDLPAHSAQEEAAKLPTIVYRRATIAIGKLQYLKQIWCHKRRINHGNESACNH